VPKRDILTNSRYRWAAWGDVNAFFGLMLDNVADLLLAVGLLVGVFGFPTKFALGYMVPGTAMGVLVGDLLFFWMAFRLARRTGSSTVTAMPLGLDTPSTFGMVFFVLGPAFLAAKSAGMDEMAAARATWHIGICAIFISGVFKLACATGSNWIRRVVPRAGLLGSLAAIALVLISFLPLIEILQYPIVGLAALAIILTTLIARVSLPGRVPGALGALLVSGAIYFVMWCYDVLPASATAVVFDPRDALGPRGWLEVFRFEWIAAMGDTLQYLPIVIPFALGTVIGGIDCTESAAAAGDEYHTGRVIAVEGFATLVAAVCGGVIQSTPYIGHPAYKAMGGRAAYTLATALFVGSAGLLGYFAYFYMFIPKATIFPIMIFIGLEITAQSFQATPKKHYAAIALACVPAMAALVIIFVDKIFGELGFAKMAELSPLLQSELLTVRILSAGFIVTSRLWASTLASLIDRRLKLAAVFLTIAAACSLFGIMHSPLPGGPIALPWDLPTDLLERLPEDLRAAAREVPYRFAVGYLLAASIISIWGLARGEDEHGES
jgi:AGZA family xanthine/uracil permease-like MFS transporter